MTEKPTGEARLGIGGNSPPNIANLVNDALPTLEADIRAEHKEVLDRAKTAERRLKAAKPPETEEDCVKLTKLFADVQDVVNDAEAIRAKVKGPFFKAAKVPDAIFNAGVRDVLDPTMTTLKKAVAKLRAEAAKKVQAEQEEAARKAQATAERAQQRGEQQDEAGRVGAADVSYAQAEASMQEATSLRAQAAAPLATATKTEVAGVRSSASVKKICTGIIRPSLDLELLRPYLAEADLIKAVNAYIKANPSTQTFAGAALDDDYTLKVGRRG